MDYPTLTMLRHRADVARNSREKVLLTPAEVYALIDTACDHLDDEDAS